MCDGSTRLAEKRSELRITPISRVWCEQKVSQRVLSSYYFVIYARLCANHESVDEILASLIISIQYSTRINDIYSLFLKLHKFPKVIIVKMKKNSRIMCEIAALIKHVGRIAFRKRQNAIRPLLCVSLSAGIVFLTIVVLHCEDKNWLFLPVFLGYRLFVIARGWR